MTTTLEATTTATSLQDRFNQAMKDIRKGGVKARRNVSGCCRSCISAEGTHEVGQPIIWHYGGQGHEFAWFGGMPYYAGDVYGSRNYHADSIDSVYFNHDGLVTDEKINERGQFVLDTFAKHGIAVEWNGTEWQCLEINFEKSL